MTISNKTKKKLSACCNEPVKKCVDYHHIFDCTKCHKCCEVAESKEEEKEKITIVPSGRIDYCGECKQDHGYDCPLDKVKETCPHTNIESNMCDAYCKDCGEVLDKKEDWEIEFGYFIKKWIPENFNHLIDTDENDGERFRNIVRSLIATEREKAEQRLILIIKHEIEDLKQAQSNILDMIEKEVENVKHNISDENGYGLGHKDMANTILQIITNLRKEIT